MNQMNLLTNQSNGRVPQKKIKRSTKSKDSIPERVNSKKMHFKKQQTQLRQNNYSSNSIPSFKSFKAQTEVENFFKCMACIVYTFPPDLIVETAMQVLGVISELQRQLKRDRELERVTQDFTE